MFRFLALIARTHAFDDTSLNPHPLLGQAKRGDLLQETGDWSPMWWRRKKATI